MKRHRAISALLATCLVGGAARADKVSDAIQIIDRGIALYKAKDFTRARIAFAAARDLVPEKANPYRWLGVTDAALGHCTDAVAELEIFLQRVPSADPRTIEAITIRDRCAAELAPRAGHMIIDTTPPDVEVRLDDDTAPAIGKTPFSRDVLVGHHVVFLRKAGLEPVTKPIEIAVGATVHLDIVMSAQTEAKTGALVIESIPTGAEVVLDKEQGAVVGHTPYRNDAIGTGGHIVIVRAPGYDTTTRSVTIGPRETVRIEVELDVTSQQKIRRGSSKVGELVVETVPPGVDVRLDKALWPLGSTPFRHEVSVGTHVAHLSKQGYKTVTKGISVAPDESVRLDLQLQKKTYYWIAGVAAPVAVGLGIGLYFLVISQHPPSATVLDPIVVMGK